MRLREVRFRDAVLVPGEARHETLFRADRFKGELLLDMELREVVLRQGADEVRSPLENIVYRVAAPPALPEHSLPAPGYAAPPKVKRR